MGTDQQHDEADDHAKDTAPSVAPSRPSDPAVVAAAAGKTTPERSIETQNPRPPSRRHNRGPPFDDDDEDERLGGDLAVGAEAIRTFLKSLGMPESVDPYYLKKIGWPIGKSGTAKSAPLIASKRRLVRHTQKIAAPQKATDAA
jgi:hypothetical protein